MQSNYICHHGIKGMHWGVRRFQPYPDGHSGGKEVGKAAKRKKYRDKLVRKADKKYKQNTLNAKVTSRDLKDLKEFGTRSRTYQDHMRNERESRESSYDWSHGEGSYRNSSNYIFDSISDMFNSNYKVNELIEENERNLKLYKSESKKWLNNRDDLMDMKITNLTTRKEIRYVYKHGKIK